MFVFNEFENLIPLSAKSIPAYAAKTSLYSYENKFYIHVNR